MVSCKYKAFTFLFFLSPNGSLDKIKKIISEILMGCKQKINPRKIRLMTSNTICNLGCCHNILFLAVFQNTLFGGSGEGCWKEVWGLRGEKYMNFSYFCIFSVCAEVLLTQKELTIWRIYISCPSSKEGKKIFIYLCLLTSKWPLWKARQ